MGTTREASTARTVTLIPPTLDAVTSAPLAEPKKRKVAAYARVSTDHEDQETSFEAQCDYYTRLIKGKDDWEFVDVYADEGISGTSMAKREGFKKMVADALGGSIDLIVTKSVSRFARNTVDSLSTIRELKAHGIEVYFEKENVYTFDPRGELLISIMSSLAQEESRSISQNVTWGTRKRMSDGKVSMPYGRFLGYERGEDGEPVVNEKEAEVVRRIYSEFLQGMTPYGIAKELTADGIPTPAGKSNWSGSTVRSILQNEKYKGAALLQKTFTTDYLKKKMKVNEGEVPQYYVENSHPAIIDPLVHDQVQRELERRGKGGTGHSGVGLFSGRIRCGECGCLYGSKVWHSNDKYRRTIWQCNHKYGKEGGGKKKCGTPHLSEDTIKNAFLTAVNKALRGRDAAISAFEAAKDTVFDTSSMEVQCAGARAEMQALSDRMQNLIRENATVALDQADYRRRFREMSDAFDEAKERCEGLEASISDKKKRRADVEDYLRLLKAQDGRVESFSAELWNGLLDHATAHASKLTFTFRDDTEVDVPL